MIEIKAAVALTKSRIGAIISGENGQPLILLKSSHRFNNDHIRPSPPAEIAKSIKGKFDNCVIKGVCLVGPMDSGKSETLAELARLSLSSGMSVDYIRPHNARDIKKEQSLKKIKNQVIEPKAKLEFLGAFYESSADLVIIDEANIAWFLDGDENIGRDDFFETLLAISINKMQSGQRVVLAMLDRQFNGRPFAPVDKVRKWAIESGDIEEIHMQASCICGAAGQISNRVSYVGKQDGFKVYSPVGLESSVQGIDDEYIILCSECFGKANQISIEEVREIVGITRIPLGKGFIYQSRKL